MFRARSIDIDPRSSAPNLVEVQKQFSAGSELFSWTGQALLLETRSSEAEAAFDRALQLHPNSPVNEGNSASARARETSQAPSRT
jgi:hypothetical protein